MVARHLNFAHKFLGNEKLSAQILHFSTKIFPCHDATTEGKPVFKAVVVLARKIWGARPHGERSSASLWRESGAEPWSGGQGAPEAEAFLVFGRSVEAVNLPAFLKFLNVKKSDICVIFAKITGGHETGEEAGAKLGGGGLGLKPPPIQGLARTL